VAQARGGAGIALARRTGPMPIINRCLMHNGNSVRLDFRSDFEMLDFVQVVSDHLGRLAGLDDEALHWVGVAVRESVINAIKHGNCNDCSKRVHVEFTALEEDPAAGLAISVRDEGCGFDPDRLPDPLAPENVLKPTGRGIFLIRSFMDELALRRMPGGGMEVRMVKRVQPQGQRL
jgi:serine/threonine-protein kinase RsbW